MSVMSKWVAGLILAFAAGARVAAAEPLPPIPLAEIDSRGIVGRLGAPLGMIVEVEGVVIANPIHAKAAPAYVLSIETVDGQKLEKPIDRYEFLTAGVGVKVKEPKVGERFRLAGFESAAFLGIVDGEGNYVGSYAFHGFKLVADFLVVGTERPLGERANPRANANAFSFDDLSERGIEGLLGARFGTIVQIRGSAIKVPKPEGETGRHRGLQLKIDTVNGVALKTSVIFPFERLNQQVEARSPRVGDRFQFVGYETGWFLSPWERERLSNSAQNTLPQHTFLTEFLVLGTEWRLKEPR